MRMAVACSCHHTVQVHQMTQPEGGSAGFYDVTMQTLEVSASAHFDFGSSVSSVGESGYGSVFCASLVVRVADVVRPCLASGANAELMKAIPNGKFGSLREPWQSGELVVPLSVLNAIVLDGRVPRMVEESDLALRILVQSDAREGASSASAKSKKRRRKVDGGGERGRVGCAGGRDDALEPAIEDSTELLVLQSKNLIERWGK